MPRIGFWKLFCVLSPPGLLEALVKSNIESIWRLESSSVSGADLEELDDTCRSCCVEELDEEVGEVPEDWEL